MSPTTSTPDAPASPDEARVELAVAALAEVTDPQDVGPLVAVVSPEPGVVDLRFACALPGYPDWHWTVSTSNLEGAPVTVLEVELLPGDGALLAPAWVPWAERLAEWRRAHPDEEPTAEDGGGGDEDDASDEEDLEADDAIDDALDDDVDDDDLLDAADEDDDSEDDDPDAADEDSVDEDLDDQDPEDGDLADEERDAGHGSADGDPEADGGGRSSGR